MTSHGVGDAPDPEPDFSWLADAPAGRRVAALPPADPLAVAVRKRGTVLARINAAAIDSAVALLLAIVAAKCLPDERFVLQTLFAVLVYLGYYLCSEALFSRTLGKFCVGLIVVGVDGKRCSWRQSLLRSVLRVVEANPALFGGLPAAISIMLSPHRQRIGDHLARTIVVQTNNVPRS